MEIGLIDNRMSSLDKFESVKLPSIQQANNTCNDIKLESQNRKQIVEHKEQDDEGEIMLLAMILLQLHGVNKVPSPVQECPQQDSPLPESPASSGDERSLQNKKKRQRTSPDQLMILEEIFETDRMPNPQTRGHLADQLGMSSRRVQIWFQNKRAKVKREISGKQECSSPESPNPASPVPEESVSPIHGNAIVPQLNTCKRPVIASKPILSASTPGTIIGNTTKQLKAQQHQFSRTAPFTENPMVLTATY